MELTIQEKLRDLRDEQKLILEKLSEVTKISAPTLQRIENNDDYHASYQDIKTLAEFYGVSADYLIGLTNSREYGTARIDELNLTNETIDVLKSGKLNNYLVCELLCHPNFQKLLSAIEIHIDRKVLPQRIENNDDYHASYQDIKTLALFYGVSADYLIGLTNSREYGTARVDELNLTNETIDVLKSGKLNNYLVCELLCHPDFQKLLSAIEIYIDRKVLPQMSTMNAMYKFTEKIITENFKVSNRDEVIAFLQQSVIDEDEYLLYRISERFNVILKNLFDKHEQNAPPVENPIISEFEKNMQYYADNRDNPARAKLTILAKQIGLNVSKLSDDEIAVLMKALQSSDLYKKSSGRK